MKVFSEPHICLSVPKQGLRGWPLGPDHGGHPMEVSEPRVRPDRLFEEQNDVCCMGGVGGWGGVVLGGSFM